MDTHTSTEQGLGPLGRAVVVNWGLRCCRAMKGAHPVFQQLGSRGACWSAREGRALSSSPRPVLGQAAVLCDYPRAGISTSPGASGSLLTFHPELRPLQSFPVLLARSVHAKLCPLCTHGRRAGCLPGTGQVTIPG